jgi:hypothetical protein
MTRYCHRQSTTLAATLRNVILPFVYKGLLLFSHAWDDDLSGRNLA